MLLVAWVGACAAFAWATRRRPLVTLITVLVLWIAIPAVATSLFTGHAPGPLAVHPAVWLVLAMLAAQLLHGPARIVEVLSRHVFLVLTIGLVVAVATLTTQQSGTGGLALLIDVVVAPVVLFLLLLAVVDGDRRGVETIRNLLLALGAGASALAVVQWLAGSVLIYQASHETRWWFVREGFDRWMATFDHPLILSMFLCVVAPLIVGLRRARMQLALVVLFTAGVTITQSRSGVVVVAVVAVWVVLRSRAPAHVRLLSLCLLAIGAAALLSSSLVEGVGERFADDTGSTGARTDALSFFGRTWQDYLVVGYGLTSSYGIAADSGLVASLENSFLMYAVDMGLVFAVLYFGAQAVLVARAWSSSGHLPGARQGALIAFLLPLTFSALAARSAAGTVLWVALALGVARLTTKDDGVDDDGVAAPERDHAVRGAGPQTRPSPRQGAVEVPLSRRTSTGAPLSA
ncbi:O-antigen ligase family protein [Actinotalea ferrariae]|uniref:O-antigen ligase family protein n=1 Tax=Actinotalea ferrariae TaxID=1386098 RepID=UPI001C8BF639|nr:O-antigen ligase family protein [Actinotalea ferrariae]MBX9246701.1 O-antigen ligase family protein [Actinotalea ferrariae]